MHPGARHKHATRESLPEPPPTAPADSHTLLEEVVRRLRKMDRMEMYDEFSLLKVMAGVVQVVVVFLLLLSVWFLMDPTRPTASVHTVLAYAAVLQLTAATLHLMRDRK